MADGRGCAGRDAAAVAAADMKFPSAAAAYGGEGRNHVGCLASTSLLPSSPSPPLPRHFFAFFPRRLSRPQRPAPCVLVVPDPSRGPLHPQMKAQGRLSVAAFVAGCSRALLLLFLPPPVVPVWGRLLSRPSRPRGTGVG